MAHSRFLLEESLTGPGEYHLGPLEAHHAFNVLRLRADDVVVVFDGAGGYAEAVIVEASKSAMTVRVDRVHDEPRVPPAITIATAIPKGRRWQGLVEKCTELGVDAIVPLLTERSVAKGEGDAAKWRRWMLEAAKQARRSWIPEISDPEPLEAVFGIARERKALLLVADDGGENPETFREDIRAAKEVVAVVGPEGGLTEEELGNCVRQGAKAIRLSQFVLRVETAAASMCTILREAVL